MTNILNIRRTPQQNDSGHLWLGQIAEALNDAGYTVNSKEILRLPVPWTKENVKMLLFKPIMQAMFPEKTSTAQLSKLEWSQVVEALNLALGERAGVHIPYPHNEE